MTYDPNDPNVLVHRLATMEQTVLRFDKKMDDLAELVRKNLCPQPGACVPLMDAMKRLEGVVGLHEDRIQKINLRMAEAQGSIRTAIFLATAIGSGIGVAAGVVVQILIK